jgi:hypothetical protein
MGSNCVRATLRVTARRDHFHSKTWPLRAFRPFAPFACIFSSTQPPLYLWQTHPNRVEMVRIFLGGEGKGKELCTNQAPASLFQYFLFLIPALQFRWSDHLQYSHQNQRERVHYGAFTPVFQFFQIFDYGCIRMREWRSFFFLETPNTTTCGLSAWTSDIPVSTHPAFFVPGTDLGPEIPTKKSFILTLLSCIFCLFSLSPCCYIALMNCLIKLKKSFSTVYFFLKLAW